MRYLVTMKPLEPFAFGSDKSFRFEGVNNDERRSYYIRTREIPEQTTVFGTIRYMVLKSNNSLNTDFKYSQDMCKQINSLIGEESFKFLAKSTQTFGAIKRMSPIFLINDKKEHIVRNPFNNKASERGYEPIRMRECPSRTSRGKVSFPDTKEFDPKVGHAQGYINIDSKEIYANKTALFETIISTGNRKNGGDQNGEDGFFKRELQILKKGYAFAVYVDIDDSIKLLESDICYMGQKKSAFEFTACIISKDEPTYDELEQHVERAFSDNDSTWLFALSDLIFESTIDYKDFYIAEEKSLRNLQTVSSSVNQAGRYAKSEIEINVCENGSVFYYNNNNEEISTFLKLDKNSKIAGYNSIVKLGGKNNVKCNF